MHLCSVVCSTVRRIGSTVRNVLTPRVGRRVATALRVHRAFGVAGINAVTKYVIGRNGVGHAGGIHLVHSNVIICANRLTSLGHVGSSIGRIGFNCRYNLGVSGCGSIHMNSIVRTCRRIRIGGSLWKYSSSIQALLRRRLVGISCR